MAVTTTKTNKPLNPRGNDQSPKGYNRAELYTGKALDFDGVNDTVNCGDVSALDFGTGNFSFSLYVKINSAQSSLENIFSKKDASASNAGYSIFYNHSTGKLLFSNANGTSASEIYSADSLTQYEDQWIHLVAVRDSSDDKNAYFYINAVKHELASTLTIYDTDNSYDFKIGNTHTGTYFNNQQVAGLKAFNVALTAAQVADLYNNPEKIVPTGVADSALKLWLPMQEGAGTTAYDGSGNGNHGTISGATWTHGIGAPVAQTAVIDWNKGQNYAEHSEEMKDSYFHRSGASITEDDIAAPDGRTTADKVNITSDNTSGVRVFKQFDAAQYTMSFYAKAGTQTDINFYLIQQDVAVYNMDIDLTNGTLSNISAGISDSSITDAGNGWWRITATRTFTAAASNHGYGAVVSNGNGTNFYLWGFQYKKAATIGPYVPTIGTAQTSDVLLPAGLTTGRDITGVNLFENVRKQGALNLDGNSWAEVHDNSSLDMSSGVSMEAWVHKRPASSSYELIMVKIGKTGATDYYGFWVNNASNGFLFESSTGGGTNSNTGLSTTNWNHLVATYDGTKVRLYIDGSLDQTTTRSVDLSNDFHLLIGGGRANQYFKDQIAQTRIYNRALTAEEVERNYNAGKNIYK